MLRKQILKDIGDNSFSFGAIALAQVFFFQGVKLRAGGYFDAVGCVVPGDDPSELAVEVCLLFQVLDANLASGRPAT